MQYSEFEFQLKTKSSLGVVRREFRTLLESLDAACLREFVRRYVHENVTEKSSHRFLESLIVASGVTLPTDDLLSLARHLKEYSHSEDSNSYAALRVAVGGNEDAISALLSTLILDARESEVQPDLLFVFQEAKLGNPELFLKCVKRCSCIEGHDTSFAGVISSVVCDLPPDCDKRTTKYITDALTIFDDDEWLRVIVDQRLCEITAGLFSLATILLELELIESVLRFTLASFTQRAPNASIVRLLATPYSTWADEVEELLPGIDDLYESQFRRIDPKAPISTAIAQFRTMVFENKQHLKMVANSTVRKKQKWRDYRFDRRINSRSRST